MTVKELKERLIDIPNEASVYVYADHGQDNELAGFFDTTHQQTIAYNFDDIITDDLVKEEYNGDFEYCSHDCNTEFSKEITAVIISAQIDGSILILERINNVYVR